MKVNPIVSIKRMLASKNLYSNFILLLFGLFMGFQFSLVPQPLLHYILYKDAFSASYLTYLIGTILIAALACIYLVGAKWFGLARKKTRKLLFVGTSISSFALGLWAFLNFPTILASNCAWLTNGVNIHLVSSYIGPVTVVSDVTLGAVEFFIATILWDSFIGTFFAVLEHLLT